MKKTKFLFIGLTLLFTIFTLTLLMGGLTAICVKEVAFAEAGMPGFSIYQGENKVDQKGDEYFVFGETESLELRFDGVVDDTLGLSILVNQNAVALNADKNNATLPVVCGVNNVTLSYIISGNSITKNLVISVGWVESAYEGVYYLPDENGWSTTDTDGVQGFVSQSADRLSPSSIRLITKNVEYLSFTAQCYNASSNRKQVCGTISNSDASFNILGTSTSGAFVLNYAFDVVTINYKPQSSGNEETAEFQIKSISTTVEYVTLTSNFDSTLGEIYYFDSKGEKISISQTNNVPKYLATIFYFKPYDNGNLVRIFAYNFTCNISVNETFEEGVESYEVKFQVNADATLNVDFKQLLVIPQNYTELILRKGGYTSRQTIENGGILELDYTEKFDVALSAPALKSGERCELFVDGVSVISNIIESNNNYIYSFGELDKDHTFTFRYSKDGNYKSVDFTYTIKLISKNTIEQDILLTDNITIANDSTHPYYYYSPVSTDRASYVAGNRGIISSTSKISFTVNESGLFAFNYFMDISEYSYCLLSVGEELNINESTDYTALIDNYGIAEAYGEFDKQSANHGNHGWRKKEIDLTVAGSQTIYIYYIKVTQPDSFVDETSDSFAISAVAHYVGEAVVNSEVRFTESGIITALTEGVDVETGSTLKVGSLLELSATPNDGYVFYGWIINGSLASTEASYSFVVIGDTRIVAVMQKPNYYVAKDDFDFYTSLKDAVLARDVERKITLINNEEITENLTIPTNIEILVPFSANDEIGFALGTGTTAGTSVSWANESKYLYHTLTVQEGVTLTIQGRFTLGAVQHYPDQSAQGHTSGAYSQIINNGTILLTDNGYLDVVGLIKGDGRIIANENTVIRMPFLVNNYSGGTITLAYYEANNFPFYNYSLVNIQCDYTINHKAKLIGSTSLFFFGSITTQDITIVNAVEERVEGGDGSLYWLSANSSIDFSYTAKSVNVQMGTTHLEDSGVTTLSINGEVTLGEFYLESFGSNEMVLGLPYTLNYIINDGAKLVVPESREYMLLPGSKMTIAENGTLDILGGLYVVEGLLQTTMAGKQYPTVDMLKNSNFEATGMLINNGTINIIGSFAGIVQSTVDGATIQVSRNATLTKVLELGAESGNNNNKVGLTLVAKISGLRADELSNIEQGLTYQSYSLSSGTEFVVSSFTMDYATGVEPTIEVNQSMHGSFAKLVDGKLIVYRTLSIQSETVGVKVDVNGVYYITDQKGQIEVEAEINQPIAYLSAELDKIARSANEWDSLSVVSISIPSRIEVNSESVYERVEAADGTIVSDIAVSAVVHFFDGKTENIVLNAIGLTDSYVQTVKLGCETYNCNFTQTVYIQKAELTKYIEDLNSLKTCTSDNLLSTAQSLYASYTAITNGLQSEQTSYVTDKISTLDCGLDSYKQIVAVLTPSNVTYGDTAVTALATTIDGKTVDVTLQNKGDYQVVNGNIQATFTYTANFVVDGVLDIPYTVNTVYGGISQKALTVIIDNKTSVYGDSLATLTASVDGLLVGDSKDDVFRLVKANGDNVGSYLVTAEKTDNTVSSYYSLQVTNGTYTITAKEITVTVSAKNVMLSKANTTVDISATLSDGVIIAVGYNILRNGELVATAINGVVTLVADNTITVGDYSVEATTDNPNYSLKQTGDNLYSVVENENYYTFDLGLTDFSKVYDGEEVVIVPIVKNAETEMVIDSTVKVNGSDMQIKAAKVYNITIEVEGYTYSAVYTINPKTISVNWVNTVATYDGNAHIPEIELVGVLSGDTASYRFDVQPINAGDYNITIAITNTDYTLDETKTHAFKIYPKDAVMTVDQHSDMMISSIKTGEIVIFTSTASENIAKENISYEVYNDSNELVFKVVSGFITVLGEVASGEYTVKAVCTDSNYNATSVDGTLTIVEDNNYYTLDVAFDSETNHKEYDGNAVGVNVTVRITESGEMVDSNKVAVSLLVNGEQVSEIKNAHDYIVKVVIDGETEYSYIYKVNARVLALSWHVGELVYNGQEQKPTVNAENVVNGDEIALVLGDFECIEQGEKIAFVKEILGVASHNYTLPKNNSFTYTINAKPIEIELSATNAMLAKVEQTLTINYASSDLSSDEVRYIILNGNNEIGTVDNGVVQINIPMTVGTYSLKAVSKNHNYVITTAAVPFEVVTSEDYYTISLGVPSLSKVYDGEDVIFNVSAVVAQSGKAVDFTFTVNSNTEYQVKDAAKYNLTVNISGVNFNYVYTVEKREVELKWSTNELIYNGYTQKPTCTIMNMIESDEVEVNLAVGESINAGDKQIIANSLVGADSANYSITEQVYKYTIKPMTLTVSVADTFSYYGSADSEITLTVKEALPGVDTLKSIVSATRESGTLAGGYAITVNCISNNYTITANDATYTILPKPITIMIDSKTSIYGDELLQLTATTNDQGADGDQISELYTLEKQDGLQKGEYVISGTCVNTNYDITFVNAVYTITAREIEFSIPDFEMVYGESAVEIVPTIPNNYSYAFDDSFSDIITINREQGNGVGSYKITATACGNENYKINRISYTSADSSTYIIKARPITLTLNDKTAENANTFDEVVELITNDGYKVTEGSIVDGDQIDIEIVVIFTNGNVTMTADNFDAYFITGNHTISIIASNHNYEITVVNATLTVTKPKLTVVNMLTEYTYNDGEPIAVFDWTKNIEGNLKGADENSFGVGITDVDGNVVEQIINAGVYNVKIMIKHEYAFEFKSDTVTDYTVTVNKKDISDKIVAVGLPENGVAEYDPFANSIYAECAIDGLTVDYEITCSEDNGEIGKFTLVATIDDSNYSGTKTFTWQIVEIDLSELFTAVGFTDNGVYVLGDRLDIKFELPSKYKHLQVSYALTNEDKNEVETISTVGEYIVKPKISDTVHYKFDVSFTIKVIANYDEIFTSIQGKLAGIESSDKWATVDEIREELKGIALGDRENVRKVDRYNEVLKQAEELLSGLIEDVEAVANTAKRGQNAQKAMEILNVITILAYFGIKQTF